LSSFNSSMHIEFINVTHGLVYSFAHQHHLLMCKKSIRDVLIIFMSWIIICTNCMISLYMFPSIINK
jgi:hypothetical protein